MAGEGRHSKTANSETATGAPAVAWSTGPIRINGTEHAGTGNVHAGGRLETLRASGQLYLADGSRLRVGAGTKLTVQPRAIRLESGMTRIDSLGNRGSALEITAGDLAVRASDGSVNYQSGSMNAQQLVVTAGRTVSEVRRTDGILLAMVRPGQTLAFSVASNRSRDTRLTGRLYGESGRYFINDEVTQVRTELQGGHPGAYAGRRMMVTGELVQSDVPGRRTMLVKQYAMLQAQSGAEVGGAANGGASGSGAGSGGAGSGGGGSAAGGAASAGAAGGAAGGTSVAVVAGVVVATVAGVATTVGLVAANNEEAISPQ